MVALGAGLENFVHMHIDWEITHMQVMGVVLQQILFCSFMKINYVKQLESKT